MEIKQIDGQPDYSLLIDLINAEWPVEFGEKSDEDKIKDMSESHDEKKDRLAILCEDDEIIGFYRYSSWPRTARKSDTAHTYDIAVLPSQQRRGLGTMLMRDMINDCRSQGFKKLLSRSFRSNTASIRLHERSGFIISMETEDSIVWQLSLSSSKIVD